jgi:DNA invertase Pin-like site-specific DNA recombinase
MKPAVPYYRVSTDRQGFSGLGLDAQRKSVHDYAALNSLDLLNEYTEIESGRKNNRPILHQAIDECKRSHAILLIAKLDRLGRNVAFISKLMESDIDFVAVDNPFANKLIVHIMAAFAEYERDQISSRTRDALQAAKRRGVELGKHGKNILSKYNREASDDFALKMKPLIEKLYTEGFDSVREITAILNEREVRTFSGNGTHWHVNTVHRLLKRIEEL